MFKLGDYPTLREAMDALDTIERDRLDFSNIAGQDKDLSNFYKIYDQYLNSTIVMKDLGATRMSIIILTKLMKDEYEQLANSLLKKFPMSFNDQVRLLLDDDSPLEVFLFDLEISGKLAIDTLLALIKTSNDSLQHPFYWLNRLPNLHPILKGSFYPEDLDPKQSNMRPVAPASSSLW